MESHLLQMRGLKHACGGQLYMDGAVASFTDAWIETSGSAGNTVGDIVASFTDAWIETTEDLEDW